MAESPSTDSMFILVSIGDLAVVLGPWKEGTLSLFGCRRMSPVDGDGHGLDGCTWKVRWVDRINFCAGCVSGGGGLR